MRSLPPELARLLEAADPALRESAWASLVKTHSRLLLHVARATGGDYDAAMDRYAFVLEQLRADDFRRIRSFSADGRSKFSTWLVVVARRLCVDHHRQRYGRPRGSPDEENRRHLADLCAEQLDVAEIEDDSATPADRAVYAGEVRDALDNGIAQLDPRDRLLLRLRFEDDLSAAQIAAIMHFTTPFHVYRRITQVLSALRAALMARGVESPVS